MDGFGHINETSLCIQLEKYGEGSFDFTWRRIGSKRVINRDTIWHVPGEDGEVNLIYHRGR